MNLLSFLFPPAPTPAPGPPQGTTLQLSSFIHGEDRHDRLERIYCDAAELLRRMYAGIAWSRREMRFEEMGARRWASAYQMLVCANLIDREGNRVIDDAVMARRQLKMCRDHFAHAMRQGNHTLPF
jgi:hypothetical protein